MGEAAILAQLESFLVRKKTTAAPGRALDCLKPAMMAATRPLAGDGWGVPAGRQGLDRISSSRPQSNQAPYVTGSATILAALPSVTESDHQQGAQVKLFRNLHTGISALYVGEKLMHKLVKFRRLFPVNGVA